MKIEDQVCTLEQSTRLKGLGITKPGIFNWAIMGDIEKVIWGNIDKDGGRYTHWLKLPAYTVAELGEMLPAILTFEKNNTASILFSKIKSWFIGYNKNPHGGTVLLSEGKTEAQARASMLIHLLETGILNPEQIQP